VVYRASAKEVRCRNQLNDVQLVFNLTIILHCAIFVTDCKRLLQTHNNIIIISCLLQTNIFVPEK